MVNFIGVVAQQLLVLPHHPERPTPLPFKTTHLFLVGTRSVVQEVGINYSVPPSSKPRTLSEKQAMVRKLIELALDPIWIEANGPRFEFLLRRALTGIRSVSILSCKYFILTAYTSNRPGPVIGDISFASDCRSTDAIFLGHVAKQGAAVSAHYLTVAQRTKMISTASKV